MHNMHIDDCVPVTTTNPL